jgi:hypothetical protein
VSHFEAENQFTEVLVLSEEDSRVVYCDREDIGIGRATACVSNGVNGVTIGPKSSDDRLQYALVRHEGHVNTGVSG